MEQRENYLSSNDAYSFFQEGFSFSGDHIFKLVLRYFAVKRCKGEIERLAPLSVHYTSFSSSNSVENYISHLASSGYNISLYYGTNLPNIKDTLPDGWKELPSNKYPVVQFLTEAAPTSVYINEELEKALIFVTRKSDTWNKRLTLSLCRILTWLYPDGKLDNDEKDLLKAIDKNDSDTFYKIIDATANLVDFRKARARKELSGWGLSCYESKVSELTASAANHRRQIDILRENFSRELRNLEMCTMNLTALKSTPPEDNNELYEFFACRKHLSIQQVQKGQRNILTFQIVETLEHYDKDEFVDCYKRENSYLSPDNRNSSLAKEVYEIMHKVFAEERGKIRIGCVFALTDFTQLQPQLNLNYAPNTMPHPHITNHTCLGSNSLPIQDYLRMGNWELALEQALAASKNINFGDSGVVGNWMRMLHDQLDTDSKFIIADNGTEMTPREFLAYVKEDTNG